MTGRCYYCAAGEHHECFSETCTCCGERNREHKRQAAELAELIRADMRAAMLPVVPAIIRKTTGGEK